MNETENNGRTVIHRVMCRTEHWYAQYDPRFEKGCNRMVVKECESVEAANRTLLEMFNDIAASRGGGPFATWDEAVAWRGGGTLIRAEGQRRDGSRGYKDKVYSYYTEEYRVPAKKANGQR